jgi:hypothetical protein
MLKINKTGIEKYIDIWPMEGKREIPDLDKEAYGLQGMSEDL